MRDFPVVFRPKQPKIGCLKQKRRRPPGIFVYKCKAFQGSPFLFINTYDL